MLSAQPEAEGCSVVVAINGLEALDALKREVFDGIISDIQCRKFDAVARHSESNAAARLGGFAILMGRLSGSIRT